MHSLPHSWLQHYTGHSGYKPSRTQW